MKNKNITFISLNYMPEDSAIGLYSTQWVNFLEQNGYKVSVVTAFPYYPQWEIFDSYKSKNKFFKERKGETNILRYKQYVPKKPTFFKRIIHLTDFTFGSFFNLLKIKECDVVISIVPFTTSILLGFFQKKRLKAKLWTHVQDFEFDAALQTGIKNRKHLFSTLFRMEKWLFSKTDISSTISLSMLERLSAKTKNRHFFLPNWIDENDINPKSARRHNYLSSNKKKILYSGNIGDKQDWEIFVRFCYDLDSSKYDIIVVGDGSKKKWLISKLSPLRNVNIYPPVPFSELSDLLCSTNLHILFQKPEVLDTVMPSKVLGMMASTKPSIIIGNPNSEIKNIIEISRAGIFHSEYSKKLIMESLESLLLNEEEIAENGIIARDYVIDNYSKNKILSKMLGVLQDL